MRWQSSIPSGILTAVFAALLCCAGAVLAQTTAITYQGKLTDAGNPANGDYDLQFRLFDTVTPGTGAQQGATVVIAPATAAAGVFTVTLDFGASVFSGADRFLEIGVRPAGSAAAYDVLAPRQPVTASPYAIQTLNAQQLGGLPADAYLTTAVAAGSFVKNGTATQTGASFNIDGDGVIGGSVGIGVAAPTRRLDVFSTSPGISAIYGESQDGTGVHGKGSNAPGVFGQSNTLEGVMGTSATGTGVFGLSSSSTASTPGVYGVGFGDGGVGVRGDSAYTNGRAVMGHASGSGGIGVYGEGVTGRGVWGQTETSHGVHGEASVTSGVGVYAKNSAAGLALYIDGNAAQTRAQGGLVKAMALINATGTVGRCYNGLTGSSGSGCGFTAQKTTATGYTVNFGFQVDDRFVAFFGLNNPGVACFNAQAYLATLSGNNATFQSYCDDLSAASFFVFVY